jgi:hypothetical protein
MRFDDPICPVCDRPALPDDVVVKAGHDITHLGCLPSGRTAAGSNENYTEGLRAAGRSVSPRPSRYRPNSTR